LERKKVTWRIEEHEERKEKKRKKHEQEKGRIWGELTFSIGSGLDLKLFRNFSFFFV
jgi:hypothetical protein